MKPGEESPRGGRRTKGILAKHSPELPLVTIVTAVLNGCRYITECLESVLAQDYPNIEHLVMDGGSVDGTVDVLREYDDRVALWVSQPDHGVYDAWNKALKEARGEWICFLGADDEFLPGAVSSYMDLAAKHPAAEYMSSQVRWVHSSGYQRTKGGPWVWKKFSRWMCVEHVGSMHRRSLYERLGMYDTSFGTAADYELLLRARDSLKAAYLPVVTAIMRGGGMTTDRSSMADATRAKIFSGGRNAILAKAELCFANAKFPFRPLRRALGRLAAR